VTSSVLIVDDSQIVRKVMRNFFETLTDWKIAGEASDGTVAIQKAVELKPDLILLDFSMPNMNGIESASVLKKALPDVHIILFTAFDEHLGSKLSATVGVDVVVSKSDGLTGLIKAVQGFLGTAGLIKIKVEATGQTMPETALE
jgi:two-component system response regulator NreC